MATSRVANVGTRNHALRTNSIPPPSASFGPQPRCAVPAVRANATKLTSDTASADTATTRLGTLRGPVKPHAIHATRVRVVGAGARTRALHERARALTFAALVGRG